MKEPSPWATCFRRPPALEPELPAPDGQRRLPYFNTGRDIPKEIIYPIDNKERWPFASGILVSFGMNLRPMPFPFFVMARLVPAMTSLEHAANESKVRPFGSGNI